MNKKVVGSILVVVVIAVIFIFTRPNKESTSRESVVPTATETASSSVSTSAPATSTITITDSGFSPTSLTIAVGSTVTFKNESNASVWPASDPHPTHTNVGGFDAKKGLKRGESYSFTFTKSGTVMYHNHLNPGVSGSIVVQ